MQLCARAPANVQRTLLKVNAARSKRPCTCRHPRLAAGTSCSGSVKVDDVKTSHDQAASLPSLLAVPFFVALPAFAEEGVETAAAAAQAAPAAFTLGPAEVFVLLSPIIVYGGFNIYRTKYNPRATFIDFMLIFGAFAVLGNIFSIFAFHQRIF